MALVGLIPSGQPVGKPISEALLNVLWGRRGISPAAYPIIEEGSYDDFKACVFRACAGIAHDVAMRDMMEEFYAHGIYMDAQPRQWDYFAGGCVTKTHLLLELKREGLAEALAGKTAVPVCELFERVALKHGFVYTPLALSARRRAYDAYDGTSDTMMLTTEIMWPAWV